MRLGVEWIAPWIHGKPIKTWIWHKWKNNDGPIQGGWSVGCNLLGFFFCLTTDAVWSGIGLSINLFKKNANPRRERALLFMDDDLE